MSERPALAARGLYAIVDVESLARRSLDLRAFANAVLQARPAAIQLRAKGVADDRVVELLSSIAVEAAHFEVSLVANDRPDLALAASIAWVHVGQTDRAVAEVRAMFPSLGVGVSTHEPEQVALALASRPDYVAFGPVFDTRSKVGADPVVGLDGLARAASVVRSVAPTTPLVAIGGVTLERAPHVAVHAQLGAVIADLLPPASLPQSDALAWVTGRARELHAALGGTERR